MSHFAYEEVQRRMDEFAIDPRRTPAFRRAYVKFLFMVAAYAYADHADEGTKRPTPEALACAWEDAQMAFVGNGEQALVGVVLQMWVHLDHRKKKGEKKSEEKQFQELLTEAFATAEERTPAGTARQYLAKDRKKPILLPREGLGSQPHILPARGVKLRDRAIALGEDPNEVEDQWFYIELVDRGLLTPDGKPISPPAPPKKGSHLRLVANNPED